MVLSPEDIRDIEKKIITHYEDIPCEIRESMLCLIKSHNELVMKNKVKKQQIQNILDK